MKAFVHGIVLASGLILPLGVQNMFVLSQGIVQPQFWRALPAAVAAAVCDTVLILLAVQGMTLFLLKFALLKMGLLSAGMLFLLYMGWVSWRDTGGPEEKQAVVDSLRRQVAFAVTVSIFNPYAILDIVAVIGSSSISYEGEEKMWFVAACILVSWCWFFCLAAAGRLLRRKIAFSAWLSKISATIMWGTAIYLGIILLQL